MPVDNWEPERKRVEARVRRLDQQWQNGHEPIIHPLEGDADLDVKYLLQKEMEIKPSKRERLAGR